MSQVQRSLIDSGMMDRFYEMESDDPDLNLLIRALYLIEPPGHSEKQEIKGRLRTDTTDLVEALKEVPNLVDVFRVRDVELTERFTLRGYRDIENALKRSGEIYQAVLGLTELEVGQIREGLSQRFLEYREKTQRDRERLSEGYLGYPVSITLDHAEGDFETFREGFEQATEAFYTEIGFYNPHLNLLTARLNRIVKDALIYGNNGSELVEWSDIELEFDTGIVQADDTVGAKEEVDACLRFFVESERRIIIPRYGIETEEGEQTFAEVGRRFGFSRQRAQQIEKHAFDRLREYRNNGK